MRMAYNKLWSVIASRRLGIAEFREMAQVGAATFARLQNNEPVSLDELKRFCVVLRCKIDDIVDFTP